LFGRKTKDEGQKADLATALVIRLWSFIIRLGNKKPRRSISPGDAWPGHTRFHPSYRENTEYSIQNSECIETIVYDGHNVFNDILTPDSWLLTPTRSLKKRSSTAPFPTAWPPGLHWSRLADDRPGRYSSASSPLGV